MAKVFTFSEIASHNSSSDLWMVINDKVYDITKFIPDHPGGEEVLLELGGMDGTEPFDDIGHSEAARKMLDDYLIGSVDADSKPESKATFEALPTSAKQPSSGGMFPFLLTIVALAGYAYYKYL